MSKKKKLLIGAIGVLVVGGITYALITRGTSNNDVETTKERVTENYSKKELDKQKKREAEQAKESSGINENDDVGEAVQESSEELKIYDEEAAKKVKEEEDKRRKENEFATKMSSEELQKRLSVSYDRIDWKGISMTEDEFKQWLDVIVPNYLDNIYTVNLNVEDGEILVAVIGDTKETTEVEKELKPVLLDGIKHSVYGPNKLTPRFYSGLLD